MDTRTTRCIECGGLVDSLNEDEHGASCPACADRLLETLPGVFHRPWMEPWPRNQDADEVDEMALLEEEADERSALRPADEGSFDEDDRPA